MFYKDLSRFQGLIYGKVLKLGISTNDDNSSLMSSDSKIGNICNLMSEDAYNVMTCFWIGHYTWAIPLKVGLMLINFVACWRDVSVYFNFTAIFEISLITFLLNLATLSPPECPATLSIIILLILQIFLLMYLLYRKLGVSAIVGATCCIAIVTPLQFYIGKKMSNNSKAISVIVYSILSRSHENLIVNQPRIHER